MKQEQDKKKPLYIPLRVRQTNKDFVEGFGAKEAVITAVACMVALILFLMINAVMHNVIVPLAVAIIVIGGTVSLVFRDQFNESIIDKIVFMYKFTYQEQKRYEYKHNDYRFPDIRKFCEMEEEE